MAGNQIVYIGIGAVMGLVVVVGFLMALGFMGGGM